MASDKFYPAHRASPKKAQDRRAEFDKRIEDYGPPVLSEMPLSPGSFPRAFGGVNKELFKEGLKGLSREQVKTVGREQVRALTGARKKARAFIRWGEAREFIRKHLPFKQGGS